MTGADCVRCNVPAPPDRVLGPAGKARPLPPFIPARPTPRMPGPDGAGIELDAWRAKLVWRVAIVKWVLFDCVDLVAGLREAECARVVGGAVAGVDGAERSVAAGGAEAAGVGDVLSAGDAEFSSW